MAFAQENWHQFDVSKTLDVAGKPLLGSVVLMILFQLAVIYTPAFNSIFKTQPLRPVELLWASGCAFIVFFAVEIEKWMRRASGRYRSHNNS